MTYACGGNTFIRDESRSSFQEVSQGERPAVDNRSTLQRTTHAVSRCCFPSLCIAPSLSSVSLSNYAAIHPYIHTSIYTFIRSSIHPSIFIHSTIIPLTRCHILLRAKASSVVACDHHISLCAVAGLHYSSYTIYHFCCSPRVTPGRSHPGPPLSPMPLRPHAGNIQLLPAAATIMAHPHQT